MEVTQYAYSSQPSIIHTIDNVLIPPDSLLAVLQRNSKTEVVYTDYPDIGYVISYTKDKPFVHDKHVIEVLDAWGVYRSHDAILADEDEILNNPSYNQDVVMDRLWKMDNFKQEYDEYNTTYSKPDNLLFYYPRFTNVPTYDQIKQSLTSIDFLFQIAKNTGLSIVVAGEYIFRLLTGTNLGMIEPFPYVINDNPSLDYEDASLFSMKQIDVDVFLITDDPVLMVQYINNLAAYMPSLVSMYQQPRDSYMAYTRTKDSISITITVAGIVVLTINIMLISYVSILDVLYRMEIDCCCVGWDGQDVYMTERGRYAIYNGVNTTNPALRFPDYEYILAKYGALGVSVMVHDIDSYVLDVKKDGPKDERNALKKAKKAIDYLQYVKKNGYLNVNQETIDALYLIQAVTLNGLGPDLSILEDKERTIGLIQTHQEFILPQPELPMFRLLPPLGSTPKQQDLVITLLRPERVNDRDVLYGFKVPYIDRYIKGPSFSDTMKEKPLTGLSLLIKLEQLYLLDKEGYYKLINMKRYGGDIIARDIDNQNTVSGYVSFISKHKEDYPIVWQKLELLLSNQTVRDKVIQGANPDFYINSPLTSIVSWIGTGGLIDDNRSMDVISSLVIDPDVYNVMQVIGEIDMSQMPEFIINQGMDSRVSPDQKQDWYVGPFVSRKLE